ncbi:MAG TPA: class I SAM-dependent methyltransferase [Tepidisphaeraceae bacterium]|jgi:2-polyprenyl-6-hydroxyphenyl methylase/3-demethylubiquinone-9 3-methyltransferase|nr:class I SAM-dependent methyltransferase [Tepidisphaeraceae bacterium]
MDASLFGQFERTARCKCCGNASTLYDVVDFNKNCEQPRRRVLETSGVPVYYHRCSSCDFIFTTAFDHFTPAMFASEIYNTEYRLVDPDYEESRPRGNAELIGKMFAASRTLNMLDYGGGNGLLAEVLKEKGFSSVATYDPFVAKHSARPSGEFDLLVSFEVLEHSPQPEATFADMSILLADPGLMLVSTVMQPSDLDATFGIRWWYIAPRNGHVSIFSPRALDALVRPFGFTRTSLSPALHLLYKTLPDFATHLLR